MLTQATHLSQHKQTQPITRWVIRYEPPRDGTSQQHTVLTQATTSDSTNKHSLSQDGSSDQEMGHLSSILCSHKQHIYHSTNKHSLSQDGSSDTSRQKMGHLSSILCSHTQHSTHPTQTQPQASHPGCGSCQSKQEPSKRCPTDVPYSTLNGLGLQITTPFLHGMHKTLVCFNWES